MDQTEVLKKFYSTSAFISVLAVILFLNFAGCASSNSSSRYSPKNEKKTNTEKTARFTSEDSNIAQKENITSSGNSNDFISEEDDPDDMPENEDGIDISEVVKNFRGKDNSNSSADMSGPKEQVLMEIIKYLNTPYKFGGNSKKGIDCSAFTQTIYSNTLALSLLRSAREQYTQGKVIDSREDLEFGDLIFFNTRRKVRPGHVGIYIGDNLFAHASSKHGVIVSSLDHAYYSKRYMGGRRLEEKF
jgi:cell wall-associated NlpC family hydrolase